MRCHRLSCWVKSAGPRLSPDLVLSARYLFGLSDCFAQPEQFYYAFGETAAHLSRPYELLQISLAFVDHFCTFEIQSEIDLSGRSVVVVLKLSLDENVDPAATVPRSQN
jgi:hypothetical protein